MVYGGQILMDIVFRDSQRDMYESRKIYFCSGRGILLLEKGFFFNCYYTTEISIPIFVFTRCCNIP